MLLPFTTRWGKEMPKELQGKPNMFVEKIWLSLMTYDGSLFNSQIDKISDEYAQKFGHRLKFIDDPGAIGKRHTIRNGDRWSEGMKAHPVINNRSKNVFQFTPTLIVKSVQEIFMTAFRGSLEITIDDNNYLFYNEREALARRDGFDNYKDFEHFFIPKIEASGKDCFSGQIIHWTDFKY